MKAFDNIPLDEYQYILPEEKISKYPLEKRDSSKLLIYRNGHISDTIFSDIDKILPQDSSLCYNNTKVIHARLEFQKASGASIEIFCLSPVDPVEYQTAFTQTKSCTWMCMVGNLKKWKSEILQMKILINKRTHILYAEKIKIENDKVLIKFSWDEECTFGELIESAGIIPIPPYLKRKSESIDKERYQTIYSKFRGSVAAPTAGLHFTENIIARLTAKGITLNEITLHVGAGTFQPIKATNALDHTMHTETVEISDDVIRHLTEQSKGVIATGTTTLRTLESLYWLAIKSIQKNKLVTEVGQWDYKNINPDLTLTEALHGLIDLLAKERIKFLDFKTSLMIVPGYQFRVVDILITNYHQPGSTLLLLVAAFVGDAWKDIYRYALSNNFRFLSYGDSSILWQKKY
ncbi:MAG: S-adenosylmethionine:tRNA ribosyltransferase-isomerase [Bacteroidales bacterium]|nr:S-adenosylmethionine:tRNA ribosyltransferase-isomerase [Bacteroidales bacterium]